MFVNIRIGVKMRRERWSGGLLLVVAGALLFIASGCERTTEDQALTISPRDTRLTWNQAVTLVVTLPEGADPERTIQYPLEWRVSNPALGSITRAGGNSAVYVAERGSGANAVFVRDQTGAEGVASIVQSAPASD